MSVNRPKVSVPSATESAQFLRSNDKFFNIKDGQTALLRFLPATDGAPSIFYPVANHHGFQREDGDGAAAIACLSVHGVAATGRKCLLCDVLVYAKAAKNATFDSFIKDSGKRQRYYTQVLVAQQGKDESGKAVVKDWSRPMLIQWSQTAKDDIHVIAEAQQNSGDDLFYDPDNGQALMITRNGTGFDTKYRPERSSIKVSLDVIRPTWGDEFIDNIYKAVGLNIYARDVQRQYLERSYPKIDWEPVFTALGVDDED